MVVACSGGPDSTALLLALVEVGAENAWRLVPAYVDHGIRSTAERQAERGAAERVAASAGLELAVIAVEPGWIEALARRERRSLEDVAREVRLARLRETAVSRGCPLIALGHTADDQVETLVMRFFQGSGAAGLAGMRAVSGDLLRPLLACSRDGVRSFLESRGATFHTDSSNSDIRFLRNAVRSKLAPEIRRVFPGHGAALAALSRKMGDLADFAAREAERRCPWTRDGEHSFTADAARFFSLAPALRSASLYAVLDRVAPRRTRFPFRLVESLARARRPESAVFATGTARIDVRGDRIVVSSRPGDGDIVWFGKTGYFTHVAELAGDAVQAGPCRLALAAGEGLPGNRAAVDGLTGVSVRLPFVLRSRRRGDRVQMAAGTTSLKKLLNEWGVPLEARDDVAVLADAEGVAAVLAWPWGARAAARLPSAQRVTLAIVRMGKDGVEGA